MIYAVIWIDFGTPLSLHCADAEAAIAKAQDMAGRAALQNLRAVSLSPEDKLTTLWEPIADGFDITKQIGYRGPIGDK